MLRKIIEFEGAGVRLVADAWGDPAAPPVLLLHGGGQTRAAWEQTGAHLARQGFRAVAPDLRGHGDSDWPAEARYDPDDFASDLEAVVSALGPSPAVVGASLGGIMALAAQRRVAEQLFGAVVLVDIVPRMESAGVERIVSFMLAHPEGFETLEDAAEAIATYRPQRPRPKNTSGLRRTLRQTENGRWHWRWDVRFLTSKFQMTEHGVENVEERRALMEKFLLEGARKLTVPALLIRGATSDVVSLDGVSAFLEAVPHSEFVDVEQAGHMVAGDRNDVFADAVSEFLGRVYPIPAEWKHSEENQT